MRRADFLFGCGLDLKKGRNLLVETTVSNAPNPGHVH